MQTNPNKLTQFWQELKRRKVIKVIAMYAATAFIIMEAAEIMLPRLGLPDWTVTFIIILLIMGFPITIILSWIFDVTPEGIKKTESIKEVSEQKSPPSPVKRRLKASDVIITVLVVVVVILAYPKLFKGGGNLKAITTSVTVLNENGEEVERQVFKEEYVHKLMIFQFQGEQTVSSNQWLRDGILDGIREDLLQFQYVLTYGNSEATHLQEQITTAKINNCPYFLTGTYKVTNGYYKITSRLHQTINGTVEKERVYQGTALFSLFDSISLQTRIDLGISKNIIKAFPDLPFQEHTTGNLTAFQYYIYGQYNWAELSTRGKLRNYYTVLDLDSTFALAAYSYARDYHYYQFNKIGAEKFIGYAMRHRQRLPEYRNIQTRITNFLILGETEKAIALLEMLYKWQPYNIELLLTLIDIYNTNFLNAKAEIAIKELNELVPDYPDYQIMLAKIYLLSGKVDEGLKYIEKRIEENPGHTGFILKQGQFYLHLDDLDKAEDVFNKALLLSPENEQMWLLLLDHIKFARNKTFKSDDLQKFTGRCRDRNGGYYFDMIIHNGRLFRKEANQGGYFYYPLSDTSFTGIWEYGTRILEEAGFNISSYCTNRQGKVFKLIDKQSNASSPDNYWKQDSLILRAEKLVESNKHEEALIIFQNAYLEYPEHFYLAHYIQHLEFILGQEYEKIEPVLESYVGEYFNDGFGYMNIFKEENQFFFDFFNLYVTKLLPLSEDQFMIPDLYAYTFKFVKKDNQIIGFRDISSISGHEFFFEKTSSHSLTGQSN